VLVGGGQKLEHNHYVVKSTMVPPSTIYSASSTYTLARDSHAAWHTRAVGPNTFTRYTIIQV